MRDAWREVGRQKGKGIKKELRCVMFVCQPPTRNVKMYYRRANNENDQKKNILLKFKFLT